MGGKENMGPPEYNKSEKRASGWLERVVRRMFPRLTMTRAESLWAMGRLQIKLNEQREETKRWKARCLKVEQLYADQFHAMRKAAEENEGLAWRTL